MSRCVSLAISRMRLYRAFKCSWISDVSTSEMFVVFFFFFQAEDGIRDYRVIGVQTCALRIWKNGARRGVAIAGALATMMAPAVAFAAKAKAAKGVHCEGTNDCKGKGNCKSTSHDCKGKNEDRKSVV